VSYRGKKWSVNRRFKEFSEMNTFLMSLYPDLPKCPPKTLFALSKAADIEKRRIELDNYLQVSPFLARFNENEFALTGGLQKEGSLHE
jgi:PX domain